MLLYPYTGQEALLLAKGQPAARVQLTAALPWDPTALLPPPSTPARSKPLVLVQLLKEGLEKKSESTNYSLNGNGMGS